MGATAIEITDVPPQLLEAIQNGWAKFVLADDTPKWVSGYVAVIGGQRYGVTYVHTSTAPDGMAVLGLEKI